MTTDLIYITTLAELIVNTVGLVLGIVLLLRAHDNRLMLIWGVYTVLIMLILASGNIDLILGYTSGEVMQSANLLEINLLMITFVAMTWAALFPILSLRPNWLNLRRRLLLAIPILMTFGVVRCFYWFDGAPTPLHHTSDIFANIDEPDVQMRVSIFIFSIITTLFVLSIPFLKRWVGGFRRMSKGMYIYNVSILLMIVLYFFGATTSNTVVDYADGYVLAIAPIVVSIIFLYNENPLSHPVAADPSDGGRVRAEDGIAIDEVMSPELLAVYQKMEQYMQNSAPYIESNYSIANLGNDIEVEQSKIIRAIRERGFSGYSEYITYLRINHFKMLAKKLPGLSIKDLMYGSGFSSRSSFYRRFAQQENMSPGEYLERYL